MMIATLSKSKNPFSRKVVRLSRFCAIFPILFLLLSPACKSAGSKDVAAPVVTFKAADGVTVTATLFKKADSATWIVLCHQAGYSRGEYSEIAPKLMVLGFNCMAIDARAGGEINDVENQTAASALSLGKKIEYLDAKQDIESAVNYAFGLNGKKVILFGSSYSASLSLVIATENPKVLAVVAFSPGEYFGDRLNVSQAIEHLALPTFVTSAKKEASGMTKMFHGPVTNYVTQFLPSKEGVHGASALWSTNADNDEYWKALTVFLKPYEHTSRIRQLMKSVF
jgi:dienelactone hydrolase